MLDLFERQSLGTKILINAAVILTVVSAVNLYWGLQ